MQHFKSNGLLMASGQDLIISSDQPQEAAKGNDFFLPTVQLGRLEVMEITFLGQVSENSSGTELGENLKALCRVHPSRQLAEEESTGRAQPAAGACRLVYFGAEGHFITSWNHRMLKQMGPDRSYLIQHPCFMKEETEARDMNLPFSSPFLSLPY